MKYSQFHLNMRALRPGARALSLALSACLLAGPARAQVSMSRDATTPTGKPAASVARAVPAMRPAATAAKPSWSELSAAQRAALAPLATHWDGLSASQKRKWIALSKNHHELPLPEQALLHARMDDWVMLSPQQRRAARLNFAETKRISGSEKQQQWEAYQALSPDARSKLTESASAGPPGAAVAVQPVPPKKLATVPMTGPNVTARPKLAAPNQIDPHTLLPQRAAPARGAVGAGASSLGSEP